jgi:heptosyltransferase-2
MKRILIVTVNWLGDALLTTPAPQALKETVPNSYVAVMAEERVTGVFENNPYVDEVISFKETSLKKSLRQKLALINTLRKGKFDTVFLIHRSATRALICLLAGIGERVGYRRAKTSLILTKKITPPPGAIHRQDYYLSLFEKSGVVINNRLPQFYVPAHTKENVSKFLQKIKETHPSLIGIHACANWELKRWPAQNFARLADRLAADFDGAVTFIGTEKDKAVIAQITKNMRNKAYDLCRKTNLGELAALMQNMKVFISNDSGPAHLAAALGVNTIVLFGPTAKELTAPRGRNVKIISKTNTCKIPCYNLKCQDNRCMKDISVEDVFEETRRILE